MVMCLCVGYLFICLFFECSDIQTPQQIIVTIISIPPTKYYQNDCDTGRCCWIVTAVLPNKLLLTEQWTLLDHKCATYSEHMGKWLLAQKQRNSPIFTRCIRRENVSPLIISQPLKCDHLYVVCRMSNFAPIPLPSCFSHTTMALKKCRIDRQFAFFVPCGSPLTAGWKGLHMHSTPVVACACVAGCKTSASARGMRFGC